jgi:type VII secretion integral membrane protein EccD
VTLIGRRRRVDAVLPSDEPLGGLMPDLLQLVGDQAAPTPHVRQVVTTSGEVLSDQLSLREAAVLDGAVLRLVAAEDAPPVPVVHDVTEEVADDTDSRSWRWGPGARRWSATVALVVLLATAAGLTRTLSAPGLVVAVLAVLLAVGGVALAVAVSEPLGSAIVLAAGAVGAVAIWTASESGAWPVAARWGAVAAVVALVLVALGNVSPLGRGGVIGGATILLLVVCWAAGALAGLGGEKLGAALAVASPLLLGVLPRIAMTASGLTGLDDRRTRGAEVQRTDVRAALDRAHLGLVLAVIAAAGSSALAGILLVMSPGRWTVPLALVLAAALVSRARSFPLAAEAGAVLGAGLLIAVALMVGWAGQGGSVGPLLVVLALSAMVTLALTFDPPEHVRTWLRRAGDAVEASAVVVSVPLALGVFGLYGELLGTFAK